MREGEFYIDIGLLRSKNRKLKRLIILRSNILETITQSLSNNSTISSRGTASLPTMPLRKMVFSINHVLISSRFRENLIEVIRSFTKTIGCPHIQMVVPSKYFANLSTIKLHGMEFRVPAKTEEYLAFRYGKDWRTPKKNWTFYKDDPAFCQVAAARAR